MLCTKDLVDKVCDRIPDLRPVRHTIPKLLDREKQDGSITIENDTSDTSPLEVGSQVINFLTKIQCYHPSPEERRSAFQYPDMRGDMNKMNVCANRFNSTAPEYISQTTGLTDTPSRQFPISIKLNAHLSTDTLNMLLLQLTCMMRDLTTPTRVYV